MRDRPRGFEGPGVDRAVKIGTADNAGSVIGSLGARRMALYLIVANQTLVGEQLNAKLDELMGMGSCGLRHGSPRPWWRSPGRSTGSPAGWRCRIQGLLELGKDPDPERLRHGVEVTLQPADSAA